MMHESSLLNLAKDIRSELSESLTVSRQLTKLLIVVLVSQLGQNATNLAQLVELNTLVEGVVEAPVSPAPLVVEEGAY